jgi:hypothetical protein
MTQDMRVAERYGTVKRLVFGYVCTFSTFAYIFESLVNLCFLFFFQEKQFDVRFNYKYLFIHYIKFRIEVVEEIYNKIRADLKERIMFLLQDFLHKSTLIFCERDSERLFVFYLKSCRVFL